MTAMDMLKNEIEVLVFDQYGTIVDMQGGLVKAATPFLKEKGWPGDPNRFVTWWRRTHFENSMIDALCGGTHTPYREIGQRAVAHVLARSGIDHTPEEVHRLVAHIESLQPFPDVIEALERLHARFRLAILSNGDPDMLEAAKPHIGHTMDETISVEAAGAFKPHWKTYAKAEEILKIDRSKILFVANHEFDCVGAKAFGMRTAFINRRKRPFGDGPQQPDWMASNFTELANILVTP